MKENNTTRIISIPDSTITIEYDINHPEEFFINNSTEKSILIREMAKMLIQIDLKDIPKTIHDRLETITKTYHVPVVDNFDEAKENPSRKVVVLAGGDIYFTYKDKNGNLGEFLSYIEDEFENDETCFDCVKRFYYFYDKVSEEFIDRKNEIDGQNFVSYEEKEEYSVVGYDKDNDVYLLFQQPTTKVVGLQSPSVQSNQVE